MSLADELLADLEDDNEEIMLTEDRVQAAEEYKIEAVEEGQ